MMLFKHPKLITRERSAIFALTFGLGLSLAFAFFVAPQTARAADTVTITNTVTGTFGQNQTVTFDAQFTGSKTPPAMGIDCGGGTAQNNTFLDTAKLSGACTFTSGQASDGAKITVFAFDTSGATIASGYINVRMVDGKMQITGSSSGSDGGGTDDPFRAYVTSILSPLFMAIQTFLFLLYFTMVIPLMVAIGKIQTGVGSCSTAGGTGFLSNICGAWQIVRNFVNMIFILIMIVIGVATILRLQSYNYKRLLGKLIIMALLVNFSLVIAQAFLKIFDIVRFTFLDPTSVSQLGWLGYKLIAYHMVSVGGVDTVQAIGLALNSAVPNPGQIPVVAAELMNLSLSFLAFGAMAAVAVYMLIATVALRILLILSPFWPALLVIPATAGLARAWWTNFLKYGMFLPILFFFLRIAIELMNKPFFGEITNGCDALKATDATASCAASMGLFSQLVLNGLQQVEVIAFVLAGLLVAKKLSIFGSGALTNLGQKAAMLPLVGAGVVGGYALGAAKGKAGRAWNEFTTNKILGHGRDITPDRLAAFALANPVSFFRGLKSRGERLTEERRAKAAAGAEQALEQLFTRGRVSKDRMYDVEDREVKEAMKDKVDYNRDQQVEEGARALHLGQSDEERAVARGDAIYNPMRSGFLDDQVTDSSTLDRRVPENVAGVVTAMTPFLEKMKNEIAKQMVQAGLSADAADQQAEDFMFYTDKNGKHVKYDPNMGVATAYYRALFGDDQVSWRMIAEQGETMGKKTNHAEYMALSKKRDDGTYGQTGKFIVKDGKAVWDNNTGATFAAREWAKLASRIQAAIAWHAIRGIGTDGEINSQLWDATSNALAENPTFAQQRTAGKLLTEDQDYMASTPGKDLIRTGVMEINHASFNAMQAMFDHSPVGSQAVAGLYNRMLGLDTTKAGLAKTLREGIKIKDDTGRERTLLNAKLASGLAEHPEPASASALDAVREGLLKESVPQNELKTRLEGKSASGSIPEFSDLVSAIEDLAKNTTTAQNIARGNIEKLAERKTGQVDFGKELNSVADPGAIRKLPPQELNKLVESVAKGARQGLINSSRHPAASVGRRMVEIKTAIVSSVTDAKIGGLKNETDIERKLNTNELARAIYNQTNTP
ncbi:MAG: type IV secretion system protein [Patescibacteria group bacterium]|nr:type IV secretion system protein [Patescibacteria group bacterium]